MGTVRSLEADKAAQRAAMPAVVRSSSMEFLAAALRQARGCPCTGEAGSWWSTAGVVRRDAKKEQETVATAFGCRGCDAR
jgi:hypothetical protein